MRLDVQTTSKTYPVFIGTNALNELSQIIRENQYTKLLVITDETVAKLHLNTLQSKLPASIHADFFTVPAGEQAKQMTVFESCHSYALEKGLDRKSCIIAFGGGAVGDLAGFVAATFMRGISFIQVPTTILAHDSAVGGKTAINHPLGKNMIGSFHQPDAVVYHTEFLKTLPDSEVRSGFAEAVKHAFIADPQFLDYLLTNVTDLNKITDDQLSYILQRGIEIKANVVSVDEREHGLRAILNFGHTLGHVIEASVKYGTYTHGECVMTGMVFALYVSKEIFGLDYPISRFISWVEKLGYSVHIPNHLTFEQAVEYMERDKKSIANQIRFVLLKEVGKPELMETEKSILEKTFHSLKGVPN